ncbi:MAG: UDP-glucose/GDP-mannose dehydrogenase family protein [Gammaproteobacteria bacterium]|nr:UDP-glucose/GDP-mannose dehydrogenase family protein [Gammaproteobacteria bacterium]MBQ0839328.1 UDP-glucose/GDP-mannose dehydrogenase family protein [Gammaproteobacteria bacterium]
MKISVFGTGYVGLVTGACLAEVGHDVICMDIDQSKIDQLNNGILPIWEAGLEDIVQRNREDGRLRFTSDADLVVAHGLIQLIAVGTPPDEDGSADLQYVLAVAKTIAERMTEQRIIVDKSTVPVGTADKVKAQIQATLQERNQDIPFAVVSNPEFLKEGAAVSDFMKPDRIIIGTDSPAAEELLRELYEPFNRQQERTVFMDIRSAELTKYAANAMLATKISFMNELSNMAELLGADIEAVRKGMGSDPRIGYHFIYPGCGYGGSCFPKDVKALSKTAEQLGYNAELLMSVDKVNERQKTRLFSKLAHAFGGAEQLKGKTIALWGLSFKPNTDDMREAPSRTLMEALWQAGAKVQAFDPVAMAETQRIYTDNESLRLCDDKYSTLNDCDALVICTEWQQFRAPDFDEIALRLNNKIIIDGRNLYSPERLEKDDWAYYAIGRGRS